MAARPSDLGALGKEERILHVDAKIADRVFYLSMADRNPNRSQVSGSSVVHGAFGAPHRTRPIVLAPQPNGCSPFVHKPSLLARAHRVACIQPTGEHIFRSAAATTLEPRGAVISNCTGRPIFCWITMARVLMSIQVTKLPIPSFTKSSRTTCCL